MVKIVYNAEFGGFSISREAVLLAREISGDSNWGDVSNSELNCSFGIGQYPDVVRHDPVLVRVVEELGERAFGPYSALRIVELPDGTEYRIDEYDGLESVETRDSYVWTKT